ncbi:MAG: hypothetical protein ABIM32_03935 [candidate division WOR-3 bacterium]
MIVFLYKEGERYIDVAIAMATIEDTILLRCIPLEILEANLHVSFPFVDKPKGWVLIKISASPIIQVEKDLDKETEEFLQTILEEGGESVFVLSKRGRRRMVRFLGNIYNCTIRKLTGGKLYDIKGSLR